MTKDICMVIPIYKAYFSKDEESATLNNCRCLHGIKKIFIAPQNLDGLYYKKHFPGVGLVRFPEKFFKSTETYNKLMLCTRFYKRFKGYRYILICQPDVWLLGQTDTLREFGRLKYDYIGAPWFPKMQIQFPSAKTTRWHFKSYQLSVGNGGLSLRNVKSTIHILRKFFWLKLIWQENEDLFFSFIGEVLDKKYKIPAAGEAKLFALETNSYMLINNKGIIPFGVHGYTRYYAELPFEIRRLQKIWDYNKARRRQHEKISYFCIGGDGGSDGRSSFNGKEGGKKDTKRKGCGK